MKKITNEQKDALREFLKNGDRRKLLDDLKGNNSKIEFFFNYNGHITDMNGQEVVLDPNNTNIVFNEVSKNPLD